MPLGIYEYNTPLVTIKQGNGRIIQGSFKLIHVINLKDYEEIMDRITPSITRIHQDNTLQPQLIHQAEVITQLISELKGHSRAQRSINWIGSAWKWIAGSPDATDWDQIMTSQNQIINNNNQQYRINKGLTNTTQQLLAEYNKIIDHLHDESEEKFHQVLFNRLTILKDEIYEIVRAVQLAKGNIVNTNLLSKGEISRLIMEIETLPYANEIEAIEYAEPMIIMKESTLLYVLSMPKTSRQDYNHIIIRSTSSYNKRIYMEFNELLLNQDEIFGIVKKYHILGEMTICDLNGLKRIPTDHCIYQLIKGLNAKCEYQFHNQQIIEILNDHTIFLSNFDGKISYNNTSRHLKGSFLVQYANETVQINNSTFINKEVKTFQVLPSVLRTNITETGFKIDSGYLHNLYLENIAQLQELSNEHKEAAAIDGIIIVIICGLIVIFFIHRTRLAHRRGLLVFSKPSVQEELPTHQPGIQPIQLNF